jgi:hypothetical protein
MAQSKTDTAHAADILSDAALHAAVAAEVMRRGPLIDRPALLAFFAPMGQHRAQRTIIDRPDFPAPAVGGTNGSAALWATAPALLAGVRIVSEWREGVRGEVPAWLAAHAAAKATAPPAAKRRAKAAERMAA